MICSSVFPVIYTFPSESVVPPDPNVSLAVGKNFVHCLIPWLSCGTTMQSQSYKKQRSNCVFKNDLELISEGWLNDKTLQCHIQKIISSNKNRIRIYSF